MIKSPLDSFGEWSDMSVFLEMKPRNELASLFVDVPPGFREKQPAAPEANTRRIKYADINVVNVTDNFIRIGAPPTPESLMKRERDAAQSAANPQSVNVKKQRERSLSASSSTPRNGNSLPPSPTKKLSKKAKKNEKNEPKPVRFGATLRDVTIKANTLCSPTFTDNNSRIFMCKVNVEPNDVPLVPKNGHQLAVNVCKKEKLDEFAAKAHPRISCARCKLQILSDEYIMTIGTLPDDDFLATTQSADFFCRDSCGAACDPDKHEHGKKREDLKADPTWLPDEKKVMISYANSVAHKSSVLEDHVVVDDERKNIRCAGCKCQLGRIQKNHPELYSFNHIAALMTAGPKKLPFVDKTNMSALSVYMSQLVLNGCETQSSMKLVIRTLDKVPYMLVWLLDSYVVIANGTLEGLRSEDEEGAVLVPFPAIKLLYKVFNNATAASDPRANGEDTSVGLLDMPLPCCELLIELLLRSSLRSPPACRAVGQFYVGYLQIDDRI